MIYKNIVYFKVSIYDIYRVFFKIAGGQGGAIGRNFALQARMGVTPGSRRLSGSVSRSRLGAEMGRGTGW